jgi:hypothetical protein
MRNHTPSYTQAALDALLEASRSRRRHAVGAIERLCQYPHQTGDCSIADIVGRDCNVLMQDGVLLTYWVDDAVCEVRIIAIEWVA